MLVKELVIATKNRKKLREIRQLLKGYKIKLCCLEDFSKAPNVKENGLTFKENAVKKAVRLARLTQKLTLGEDSGLEVKALNGAPGIYSSRFGGWPKSDQRNNRKLLKLLKGVAFSKRKAAYKSAVALADKDGLIKVVEGGCHGVIGYEPRGNSGFGYDPLFVIPKYKKTFAELGEKVKHTMSHRARALEKIKKTLVFYLSRQ
ncbi:MAG: RdgB/HAM1 family non-canonical purine NTP pyrophosphatase [Candidatus Omnitrophota bacterium]|nr:RdgB/HAM1 family non-canonical purine NTP pyrophosphatase [Candidatus Omnitrophota bacterium]